MREAAQIILDLKNDKTYAAKIKKKGYYEHFVNTFNTLD